MPRAGIFLVWLIDISPSVSPERIEGRSRELLELAPLLAPDWNRVAVTKNALVPLARINPARAMDLLSQIEELIPKGSALNEDVRADCCCAHFIGLLQRNWLAFVYVTKWGTRVKMRFCTDRLWPQYPKWASFSKSFLLYS